MINIWWCLKFKDVMGSLILIIFSDGFKDVYGVCVYVRWFFIIGGYESRFVMLKSCFVFINKRIFIDWVEFCGVVLNKRLKIVIIE